MMGLGNADTLAKSVVPKFALLAEPQKDGAVAARYFMPWKTHPSYAVTGVYLHGCVFIGTRYGGRGGGATATRKPRANKK